MSEPRDGWRTALAPTPECLEPERLGEELDEQARAHVASCARCSAELALFREFERDDRDVEAGRWIAEELQRRAGQTGNVRTFRSRPSRFLYAAAAVVLIAIGASYWIDSREPALDPNAGTNVYRATRIQTIAPNGELAQAPNEMRWTAVPGTTRYHVQILEVDGQPVWSADTTEPRLALPADVAARFAPGKTLLWSVTAYRGNEELAQSDTQNVRVSTTNTPGKSR